MTTRITIPEEHVALILSRDTAHWLNSMICYLNASTRKNKGSKAAIAFGESDRLAANEIISEYASAIMPSSKRFGEQK